MSPAILRGIVSAALCEQIATAARKCAVDRARIVDTDYLHRDTELRWLERNTELNYLFDAAHEWASLMNRSFGFELNQLEEPIQFCAYGPDHHFDWHTDVGAGAMSRRKLSLTLQLSPPEAYEGGGLEFFGAGELSVSRLQGTLIAFPSFLHHRVTPITRGKRESLVMWWHGPPFR